MTLIRFNTYVVTCSVHSRNGGAWITDLNISQPVVYPSHTWTIPHAAEPQKMPSQLGKQDKQDLNGVEKRARSCCDDPPANCLQFKPSLSTTTAPLPGPVGHSGAAGVDGHVQNLWLFALAAPKCTMVAQSSLRQNAAYEDGLQDPSPLDQH